MPRTQSLSDAQLDDVSVTYWPERVEGPLDQPAPPRLMVGAMLLGEP